VDLLFRQIIGGCKDSAGRTVADGQILVRFQILCINDFELIQQRNGIIVGVVQETQRQNAVVDQILLVDAGIALGYDRLNAKEHRRHGRVLARAALAVVGTGDDDSFFIFPAARREAFINLLEAEFTHLFDVAAVRQHLAAGRHDVIRCDVIIDFDHDPGVNRR